MGRRAARPAATGRLRGLPALARALPDSRGRVAVDDHLHVVNRNVGTILRIAAPRLDRTVLGRVPAPQGEVDAAAVGHRVVDHDDLLVVSGAERQPVVEPNLDSPALSPAEHPAREKLALRGKDQRMVPEQDSDLELALVPEHTTQQLAELRRANARVLPSSPRRQVRLCSSQPRMKIERSARSNDSRSAPKYSAASINTAARGARTLRQQVSPSTRKDEADSCALRGSANHRARLCTPLRGQPAHVARAPVRENVVK